MHASAQSWWLKRQRNSEELESQADSILVRINHAAVSKRPDVILAA